MSCMPNRAWSDRSPTTARVIRSKAPLRISFSGGGTDVPPYPTLEGGCVLSATISRYAYGSLRLRRDSQIRIHSADFGVTLTYDAQDKLEYDGRLDLIKATINRFVNGDIGGFDLFLETGVPPGSGLGASSAVVVCLVGLLNEVYHLRLTDHQIAEMAYHIEREELGIEGGMQDQYSATFGGMNFIEFFGNHVVVNPLRVKPEAADELEHNLVLCYTGTSRLSSGIIKDQVMRYSEGSSLESLRHLKELTVKMKRYLLQGDLAAFGEVLHEEWTWKKRLSEKITNSNIDGIYERAREAGAIGGKITGAGGGGYLLLYCPFEARHYVAGVMQDGGVTVSDFSFSREGLEVWTVNDD